MRQASAASMKGCKWAAAQNAAPGEGTKVRAVYDALKASQGLPIANPIGSFREFHQAAQYLQDFYGMDIRHVGQRGSRQFALVGEWFGKVYIDYVAERIEAKQ